MKIRQSSSEVKPATGISGDGNSQSPLTRAFYSREPADVAWDLIGKRLLRILDGEQLVGRIVETEAYRGGEDAASHAYGGRTGRNAPMFGPPGHAYVYFIYGMHWMFNISAHPEEVPGAVLIRALAPETGIATMRKLRGRPADTELTNGPAKLAQALAIDRDLNNVDLCNSQALTVIAGDLRDGERVIRGPRVRVPGDKAAARRPWRFWIEDNPYVSS